jgi:hypothetical protein
MEMFNWKKQGKKYDGKWTYGIFKQLVSVWLLAEQ